MSDGVGGAASGAGGSAGLDWPQAAALTPFGPALATSRRAPGSDVRSTVHTGTSRFEALLAPLSSAATAAALALDAAVGCTTPALLAATRSVLVLTAGFDAAFALEAAGRPPA